MLCIYILKWSLEEEEDKEVEEVEKICVCVQVNVNYVKEVKDVNVENVNIVAKRAAIC